MMQYQVQVPLGSLPVHLMLVGSWQAVTVVFVKVTPFTTVIDLGQVGAVFEQEGFVLHEDEQHEDFLYNTHYNYKEIPLMLKWLQQQNLEEPNVIFG